MSAKLACQRGAVHIEDACYLRYIVFDIFRTIASGNGILVFVVSRSGLTFAATKLHIRIFGKAVTPDDKVTMVLGEI